MCHCVTAALSLLEALEREDRHLSLVAVSRILGLEKRVLAHCSGILDCDPCRSMSSFMMLVILLCQRMSAIYQHIIDILLLVQGQQQQSASAPNGENGDANSQRQVVYLGDCEVDASDMPCVFGGLVTMRIRKFALYLIKLKALMVNRSWYTHCSMLSDIEERVQASLKVCERH